MSNRDDIKSIFCYKINTINIAEKACLNETKYCHVEHQIRTECQGKK